MGCGSIDKVRDTDARRSSGKPPCPRRQDWALVNSWGDGTVRAGGLPSTLSPLGSHAAAPGPGSAGGRPSPVPASGGRQAPGSGLHVGAGPAALVVGEPDLRGAGLWQMIDTKLGEVSC